MSDWWIPRSVEDLETAVRDGNVEETHHCEIKAFTLEGRVPGRTVAKAVASLAVDGGVLVLGVGEDKQPGAFVLAPQPLSGLRESVDQVVANLVTPGLRPTVRALDRGDGTGYLAVLVPASARAPHMFDGRYYGRNDSTSRPLTNIEVRELWLRHLDRRESLLGLLEREVAREPAPPEMRTTARLFVVAQPVSADPRLLLDAVEERNLARWAQNLNDRPVYQQSPKYSPGLNEAPAVRRRAHGVARSSLAIQPDRTVPVRDGTVDNHLSEVVDFEIREDGGSACTTAAHRTGRTGSTCCSVWRSSGRSLP